MTDAVSTIKLGIETGSGKEDLVSLRTEFTLLRQEIEALNGLKANAQGLVGGAKSAQSELATMGAELKASASKVNELEQQLAKLNKSQASNAKSTTDAVRRESKEQAEIQIGNAKHVTEEMQKAEQAKTKTVKEEAAKRASISSSGTYGGVKYNLSERISPELAETNIRKARLAEQDRANKEADAKLAAAEAEREAEHRALMFTSMVKDLAYISDLSEAHAEFQAKRAVIEAEGEAKHRALMFEGMMNDAKTEQERLDIAKAAAESRLLFEAEIQKKREVLMAGAGQKATLAENAEAYKQTLAEQNQEYQTYLLRQREYAQRHRELEKTFDAADKEAKAQLLKEQNQQYQEHLLNQAEHLKEWNDIEKLIEADEKEANRVKLLAQDQQYKEYQTSIEAYRQRQHDIEIAFQKAEEQEYKEHLQRQSEEAHKFNAQYNAERRAVLLDARFDAAPLGTKVGITRNAASLVNRGETGLAHETYGSEAVNAVSKLSQMEAELNATRKKGNEVVKEARAHAAGYKDGLGDVHAAVKGLTHGFDQMWMSWGSMVPMVAGFAIAASMMKVLEVGKEVEFQLQYLKTTSAGMQGESLNLDKFIGITETSMESLHDAAAAMRVLSQSGLDAKQSLIALPDVLNFATLGEMSATQAATSLSAVMHTFGKEAANFGNIGDVISTVATSTSTTSTKLVDAMRQASTSGSMFHLSLEQVTSALGVMAEKGIVGSQAGTALSTSLKNLYEPTDKAAKALAKMGIDTTDGHGGLKDTVQLIGELRQKLSTLDDAGKANFLGTITDARAAKAISALTDGYGKYNELLGKTANSQDFMLKGTLKLEDTVEGGWRRMSNALEGSFVKAFEKAEPEIRSVQFQLSQLAQSEGVIDLFTKLAIGAARVTETLVDSRNIILGVAVAYMGLRVIQTVTQWMVAQRLNTALATAAKKANTVATLEGAAATEVDILALDGQAAAALAAGRSLTFAATASRGLTAAMGPISMLLLAVYTGYEIFTARVDDSDLALKKANNTVDTTISYYDRQIKKLKELNEELEHNSDLNNKAKQATAEEVLTAELGTAQTELAKAKKKVGRKQTEDEKRDAAISGGIVNEDSASELAAAEARVAAAQKRLGDLKTQAGEYKQQRDKNQFLTDRQTILNDLKRLKTDAGGGDETSKGYLQLGTEKSRAIMPEIQTLMDQVETGKVKLDEVAPKIKALKDRVNEAKGTFKPDVKDKGANDAYRAAQLKLDGDIQLHKDNEKSGLADAKSKEKTGEMGSLEAIVAKYQVIKQAREDDLNDFKKKEDLAAAQEHRKADGQAIENKRQANIRAEKEAANEMGREIAELEAKWNQESLKSDADMFAKKGELVRAYEAQYKAAHQAEITRLDKDIGDSKLPQDQRDAASKRKGYLNSQYDAGHNAAGFDEEHGKAQEALAEMQERLQSVADKSARTNESARTPGFLSDLNAAQAADDIRNEAIPAIQSLIAEMVKLGNDPKSKATMAKLSTDLIKEANRSKDAWIAAGKSIEKSLGDSFGKGGKAVGGLISALIKQRETQKGIDDEAKRAKADPKNSDVTKQIEIEDKAREQSAQLQLGTYADMAGAAKGFFAEHSKGYEAMQGAERLFRAFEMAESIRVWVLKSGLLTSFTALFATAKTTEVAATAATVAPTVAAEGVKQGAFSVSALAGALALPFPANLPAFAIVGAMLASIGLAVSGSGGGSAPPDLAKERQKYAGTGFTYDTDTKKNPYEWELQKSDSLTKSLEKLRDNSDIALTYSSSQLTQLETISNGISGLANSIVQTTGIRGTKADENALGVGSSHSFLGFSGSSTSLTDIGIKFGDTANAAPMSEGIARYFASLGMSAPSNSQSVGSIMSGGVNAQKYSDVHSESKSFWGLSRDSSNTTTYSALDSDMLGQMNGLIKSMYGSVKDAASYLGKDGGSVTASLNSVTLADAGLSNLSFKGMSNSEVEDQLNAAFSKLGDIMAKKAMPGLEGFSKATEGYLQTLVRVSTGVDQADYSLQKLGITAVSYTDVLNKQGDVATEIVRTSLLNKETTSVSTTAGEQFKGLFGLIKTTIFNTTKTTSGIGDIIRNMTGSVDDLTQAYTKLNDIRRAMKVTGLSNADVTTSMVRGAGGLDKLSSGINDYMDKFFSEGEKASAKVALLQDEFVKIGTPMPKSIQDFKNLVNSIDRTSDAGQTLYGSLMSVAGEFGDLADASGNVNPAIAKQKAAITDLVKVAQRWIDLSKSARDMVNEITAALSKTGKADSSQRIAELKDMLNSGTVSFEQQLEIAGELKDLVLEKYQTEKQNAEDLIQYGKDLNKYVTDLKTGDLSPLTNKQKLEVAQSEYNQTLKNSMSDDKDVRDQARGDLQGKASSFLDLAHTYYTSSQEYKDIFSNVTTQLGDLGMSSIESGKTLQDLNLEQIDELKHLRDVAQSIEGTAKSEYQASLNQTAAQMTALQSMADSLGVLSGLPEILSGLSSELAAGLGSKGISGAAVNNTGSDQIEALYQTILHRQSDVGGKSFWQNAFSGGMSIDEIRADFLKSDEYKKLLINGSHAGGLDYVPFDGYVAELHRGERVLTATQARRTDKASMASTSSFSSTERDEMAAEIKELRGTMERMIEANAQNTQALAGAMHAATGAAAEHVASATKEAASSGDYDNRNKPAYQ